MRDRFRACRAKIVVACLVVFVCLTGARAPSLAADPAAACAAAKRRAAGRKADGKLRCVAKAAAREVPVDSRCLSRVEDKFAAAFAKAEASGGCLTLGDAGAIEASVDTCVGTVGGLLGVSGVPFRSLCTAGKLKAAGRTLAGKASCHAKAARKLAPVSTVCLAAVESRYLRTFTKVERKGDCLTTGDAATIESAVDSCIAALVVALPGPATTTSTTATSTTSTTLAATCDAEPGVFAGITAQHNATRASASPMPSPPLDPLCWNASVSAHAQAWADGCSFSHDPALGTLGEGQNIYAAAQSAGFPPTAAQDAEPAWASEAVDYDYATNTCSAVCGHYTQIVWRSTALLGCGIKNCTTNSPFGSGFPNWTIVVCNYEPPGNYIGQRPY
jgi:pathogenesis-related protein 1